MMKQNFRNPETNIRYTTSLFFEFWRNLPEHKQERCTPLYYFTKYEKADEIFPHDKMINFREEYVKDMDPSGYKTSKRLLEDFDHFQQFFKNKSFMAAKADWDKEIAAINEKKVREKLNNIIMNSDSENTVISASKALLALDKKPSGGKGAKMGRPSSEEVQGAIKQEVKIAKDLRADMKRIGLVKKEDHNG